MRIKQIHIERWRAFHNVTIDVPDDAPVVCLVGENGTGKSSILELVRHSLNVLRVPGGSSDPWDASKTFFECTDQVSITFDLGHPDIEEMFRLRPMMDIDQPDLHRTAVSAATDQWDRTIRVEYQRGNEQVGFTAGGISDGRVADYVLRWAKMHLSGFETPRDEIKYHYLHLGPNRWIPNRLNIDAVDAGEFRHTSQDNVSDVLAKWVAHHLAQQARAIRDWHGYIETTSSADEWRPVPRQEVPVPPLLRNLLPYLRPLRPDALKKEIIFESRGREIPFSALSSGEKDIVALALLSEGINDRQALVLFDEPEMHINPNLVRRRLQALMDTIGGGQAVIATHSYEAVETAGESNTFLLWRADDGSLVNRADPWSKDPAFRVLASALGIPAFSLSGERFIFTEGEETPKTVQRFAAFGGGDPANHFLPVQGCSVVLSRLPHVLKFAAQGDKRGLLRIGAIIDRDFRTDSEVKALIAEHGVYLHVLDCHEEDNLFLNPESLQSWIETHRIDQINAEELIRTAADEIAGSWILQHAGWHLTPDVVHRPRPSGFLNRHTNRWSNIHSAIDTWVKRATDALTFAVEHETDVESALRASIDEYAKLRLSEDLWRRCCGKEVLVQLQGLPDYRDLATYPEWLMIQWRTTDRPVPQPMTALREWITGLPTSSDPSSKPLVQTAT